LTIKGPEQEILGECPEMPGSTAGSTGDQDKLLCEGRMVVSCNWQAGMPITVHLESRQISVHSDQHDEL
jgi:hypothetical protein